MWKQILCNYCYGWKKKYQSWEVFFCLFVLLGCLFWIFFLIWGYFLLLSLRKTRNPINLQPHDLYETQIKVLCFYFTYLLMGKVLLEVHFKDSLQQLLSQLFLPTPRTLHKPRNCVRQERCDEYSSEEVLLKWLPDKMPNFWKAMWGHHISYHISVHARRYWWMH